MGSRVSRSAAARTELTVTASLGSAPVPLDLRVHLVVPLVSLEHME